MIIRAEKLILRNEYSTRIDYKRKKEIENFITEKHTNKDFKNFAKKLNKDEQMYVLKFMNIITKENAKILKTIEKVKIIK